MEQYSVIILLLSTFIAFSALALRSRIPYPVFLTLAGILVGLFPGFERINLNPQVVFLIFLPPLLYDAAFNISFKDFRANITTISRLAITLVFLTAAGIALFAYYCIPGFTWPLAFTLGAILSPTDAVAALSVTRDSSISGRTRTVIEGESLVNDASALIIYRFAVGAVSGSVFMIFQAIGDFFWIAGGGCLIGFLLGYFYKLLIRYGKLNSRIVISLNLLLPFVAYLLAEEAGVSAVLSVVVFGLTGAYNREKIFNAEDCRQAKDIWDIIIFLLNGLIFIIIGMEFPHIIKHGLAEEVGPLFFYALLITVVSLLIRFIVLFMNNVLLSRGTLFSQRKKLSIVPITFSWEDNLIIGGSGMRGIVSLATALGLPFVLTNGTPFPHRDTIIFLTITVVLIMLLFQGTGFVLLTKWIGKKERVKSKG